MLAPWMRHLPLGRADTEDLDLRFYRGPPGPRTPHQKLKRLLLYQMS
jgi:hypothetical protein